MTELERIELQSNNRLLKIVKEEPKGLKIAGAVVKKKYIDVATGKTAIIRLHVGIEFSDKGVDYMVIPGDSIMAYIDEN